MRNKKKNKAFLLLLILLGLSVGFAALSTTLKINGTTTINKNTWNIYWDNIANKTGVTPTSIDIDDEDENHPDNIVTFEVTFDKPGDYFEFEVDAVNAGTLDAEILSIQKKYNDTLIPAVEDPNNRVVPAYLKYEVTYADTGEPAVGDKLAKAPNPTANPPVYTTKTYKIRVEYDKEAVTNADINNQDGSVSHSFTLAVEYGQATPSEGDAIAERIAEIEEDPDEYRNPQQDVRNKDIGLDENGNVINLDLWTSYEMNDEYNNLPFMRDYSKRIIRNANDEPSEVLDEIVLGVYPSDPTSSEKNTGVNTIATSSENIVNGECITPIPAYIMLAGTDKFLPVTEIAYAFGSYGSYDQEEELSKFPHLPNTVTRIGESAFWYLYGLDNVVIPKQIEYVGPAAFRDAFSYNENKTLTFEEGSQLKIIDDGAFWRNGISGDLVLPNSVTYIGAEAFGQNEFTSVTFPNTLTTIGEAAFAENYLRGNLLLPRSLTYIGKNAFTYNNNLTSATLPSTTQCIMYCEDEEDECTCVQSDAFDEGVTLIHY